MSLELFNDEMYYIIHLFNQVISIDFIYTRDVILDMDNAKQAIDMDYATQAIDMDYATQARDNANYAIKMHYVKDYIKAISSSYAIMGEKV